LRKSITEETLERRDLFSKGYQEKRSTMGMRNGVVEMGKLSRRSRGRYQMGAGAGATTNEVNAIDERVEIIKVK
jgi:hypothetical protein